MKTLEKLYEEIHADSELKKEYVKAAEDKKVIDFLKAHDCDATEAELESFISSKKNKELADDELDMVSGGGDCTTYTSDGWPVVSAFNSCSHYVFMGDDNGGRTDDRSCGNCIYSKTNDAWLLICYCPQRHESVDDI
jgi:predicted ribosomally synthesized peptide with nif11-like leader